MAATVIDPYRGSVEHEMDMLGRYLLVSEQGLVHVRNDDKKVLDEQAAQIEGGWVEVTSAYVGHAFAFHEELPMIMRHGHVTAIYSFAEHQLRALCNEIHSKRGNLPVQVDDISGYPGVKSAQTYLSKIIDAKVTQWGEIGTLALLRNSIMHCNGFIDESRSPKKIEGIVKNTSGLSLNAQRRLLIEPAYIDTTYQKVCDLFTLAFTNLGFGASFYTKGFPSDTSISPEE